jgi:hypothetical protein
MDFIYPILLCILKEKCFKGSLNTYFKSKRHKIMPLLLTPCGLYLFLDLAHAFHFLVCQESSDIFKMLHDLLFPNSKPLSLIRQGNPS